MRLLLGLSVAVVLLAPDSISQGHNAEEIFTARCANCHTVPDPGRRTDRAWLDQINRTT